MDLATKMKVKQAVQQNVPFGSALLRSGETRAALRGGIAPAVVAGLATAAIPEVKKLLERPFNTLVAKPVNWLWDKLGLGAGYGGAMYRVGGFWHKPGDIGMHVPAMHSSVNAAQSEYHAPMTKRDIKNLRVLEKKLLPLSDNPEAFVRKLESINMKGEAWLKKHRKRMKAKKIGGAKKKYKTSKRYKTLKLKYYSKYPKTEFGKYYKSAKYKKHKAKYNAHRAAKKKR
jgi:hypothetical protein